MAIKKIYVHPGDVLMVHFVYDTDEKPSKATFDEQPLHNQRTLMLTVRGSTDLGSPNPDVQFSRDGMNGPRRYLQ